MIRVVLLSLVFGTACANLASQATAAACGPVPTLMLDSDAPWPASMREGGADLATLRTNFAAAFAEACAKGIIPASGPVDREGKPFDSITVAHNPNANQLFIGRSSQELGGRMYMEDAFLDRGQVRIPSARDFVYEFTCVMKPPSAEERERTGDCLYD